MNAPRVTMKNVEVLDAFMARPEMRHAGEMRDIILSEQGFHGPWDEEGERLQAAALAYEGPRGTQSSKPTPILDLRGDSQLESEFYQIVGFASGDKSGVYWRERALGDSPFPGVSTCASGMFFST